MTVILLLVKLLTITSVLAQVETSIYEIRRNPASFINENVQISGLIIQYIPSTSNTLAYYIIKDDNGAQIQVKTAFGEPVTNEKYIVSGVLSADNNIIYLTELQRQPLNTLNPEANVSVEPTTIAPDSPEANNNYFDNNLLLLLVLGLSGLLLFALIAYRLMKNYRVKAPASSKPSINNNTPANSPKSNIEQIQNDDFKTFLNSSGQNTVVIEKDYMTMKAMPGRLLVMNGDQSDKYLGLFGAQTPEGQVITIGRDSPDWKKSLKKGRENAHIRIQDASNTLSRLQAEIIYSNGEMKLRNLGQVNPTIVDDNALSSGQTVPLQNGTIIQAGNVKLRYEV